MPRKKSVEEIQKAYEKRLRKRKKQKRSALSFNPTELQKQIKKMRKMVDDK